MKQSNVGTVTLIGSGEFSDTMARLYRELIARLGAPANAVFLDTPAGFEVNSDEIAAKAVQYFRQRLDLELNVAGFRSKAHATARDVEAAVRKLAHANFIFAGPGSPSYAIRNWRGSALWDLMIPRLLEGSQLIFASAAAVSVSCCALPVYEIYKAGHELHWIDGLDLLGPFGLKLAIVPHWNNAEGQTYDTRFCYMGEARFQTLEAQLPYDVVVLGIDEYTACTLDLAAEQVIVSGAGRVTIRYRGSETFYPAGSTFSLAQLRAATYAAENPGESPAPEPTPMPELAADPHIVTTTRYLEELARAIQEVQEPADQRELLDQAHDTMHELAREWGAAEEHGETGDIAPYVELLIGVRTQLRSAKQFALADRIRAQLAEMGVEIQDTPDGTHWSRV